MGQLLFILAPIFLFAGGTWSGFFLGREGSTNYVRKCGSLLISSALVVALAMVAQQGGEGPVVAAVSGLTLVPPVVGVLLGLIGGAVSHRIGTND